MNKHQQHTLILWGIVGTLFVAFQIWHGAFETPLTEEEIDRLAARFLELNPGEDREELRAFLEEDDGKPVIMVNAILLRDRPATINGRDFGDSSAAALNEYTSFVIGYLLRRGSYPLWTGSALFDSLEVWGIENAEEWTTAALMRYRSRRVMLEMATNPEFVQFHDAKEAAIEKTFAYPTATGLATSSLSLMVSLVLLVIALLGQLLLNRRSSAQ